ncbi:MAG: glycerophosphodiester phosphodiesterase [Capsulimonadaceae bacterium]
MALQLNALRIIGYRGAPGLEPPGSTIASMRRAIDVGANMLMVDIRRTQDDVLVVNHQTDRAFDGKVVPLHSHTFAEWLKNNSPAEPPLTTLQETFALVDEARVGLIMHIREAGTEAWLVRAIRYSGLTFDSVLVASGDETSRAIVRGLEPRLPVAHTLDADEARTFSAQLLTSLEIQAAIWHHRLVTPNVVRVLRSRETAVYAWGADTVDDMHRLCDTCDVDGIVTNYPNLLKEIVSQ